MIEAIEALRISARCSMCKEVRDVELDALQVRTLDVATAIVALTPCPCGAVEFLVRAPRAEPQQPGNEDHRHHLLVDHLAAELVGRKQVAKGSKDAERICPAVEKDVLERWFPRGLRLGEVDDNDEIVP
jgi:hypothetical protein